MLKAASTDASDIVVIGAGFIGLEVASALIGSGKNVTVVEAADRVLARVAAPELSTFLSSLHASYGVKILTSSEVQSLSGEDDAVRAVLLKDGSSIPADMVVVGIGSVSNIELAKDAGIDCQNGIVVDLGSRSNHTDVFAAGDCAVCRSAFNPAGVRLESVQNAIDQSRIAGAVIAGKDAQYDSLPWFWSDQYDLKLQIAGLPFGSTEKLVRAGNGTEFSIFHFRDETCICVESINRPREHMSARRLLPTNAVTKSALQGVEFDLAALMKS
jgi:3-phenylpropionate/trans-cinnamate dioxygenase ferredoxin reductase subunit